MKSNNLTGSSSENATETKLLYPLLFAQSVVSNMLKQIMVSFIFESTAGAEGRRFYVIELVL